MDVRVGDRVVFTRLPDGNWVLGRLAGHPPIIEDLLGFGATRGDPRTTDEIMVDVRGRDPDGPQPLTMRCAVDSNVLVDVLQADPPTAAPGPQGS